MTIVCQEAGTKVEVLCHRREEVGLHGWERRKQRRVDTGMAVYILFPTTSQCLFLLTLTALVYGGLIVQLWW